MIRLRRKSKPVADCDNCSVGVLITDEQGRYLMLTRARPPAGVAPPAGHVDQHGTSADAARVEVAEEVGLHVVSLVEVASGWRSNVCRRPTSLPVGHEWTIYRAEVAGDLTPSPEEALGARWYTRAELGKLTERTVGYARGRVAEAAWLADPGLEPVWCLWLTDLGVIEMSAWDLDAADLVSRGLLPASGYQL